METDKQLDIIVKKIKVEERMVLVFQLDKGTDFGIARDLGEKIADQFGDVPFVMLFVDDINKIEAVPEARMRKYGWMKVPPKKESLVDTFMKFIGYGKIK